MKVYFLIILNSLILFSCKMNNKIPERDIEDSTNIAAKVNKQEKLKTTQDTIDIFIPESALSQPEYFSFKEEVFTKTQLKKYQNIQSKLTELNGNFLGDTDENDIIGHPDFDYDGLTIWGNETNRKKATFNAGKILKAYGLYYIDSKLILITEATKTKKGYIMDSIFFDDKILVWKNTSQGYVKDKKMLKTKEIYLKRLSKEIEEIYINELGYIEKYNYTKDSMSSFVIGNLKN